MNEEPIIRFEHVSKQFTYSQDKSQTILEVLISAIRQPKRGKNKRHIFALDDISFDIFPGQSVGIIGRNGSGKSTALKLATRIIKPTDGRILVKGRVSALLELGAGFHPDLTGRENIFLNASLLGLTKEEVDVRYDDIVAFSELGEFINMPVKHYSSGMYMRLGFSVAIHIQPDILIVDEILAVGDQAFQTKCLDRIYDLKRQGVTIIMVSHNLNVIRQICSHLIWIENGVMKMVGTAEEVSERYQAYTDNLDAEEMTQVEAKGDFARAGSGEVEITAVRLLNKDGVESKLFNTNDSLTIEMEFFAHKPMPEPEFGLAIFRNDGVHVNGPNTKLAQLEMGTVEGAGVVRYTIPSLPLLPAGYYVTTAVHDSRYGYTYDHHERAYTFRVTEGGTHEKWGLLAIDSQWDWSPINEKPPTNPTDPDSGESHDNNAV